LFYRLYSVSSESQGDDLTSLNHRVLQGSDLFNTRLNLIADFQMYSFGMPDSSSSARRNNVIWLQGYRG
jgi:hypothetical protein